MNILKNTIFYKTYKEYKNYRFFKKTIKNELSKDNSFLKRYHCSLNMFNNKFGILVNMKDEFELVDSFNKDMLLTEAITPVNKYLDINLKLCELLSVERIENIYDEENDKETLTYIIIYGFNFEFLTIKKILKIFILLLSIGICMFILFSFINNNFEWELTKNTLISLIGL